MLKTASSTFIETVLSSSVAIGVLTSIAGVRVEIAGLQDAQHDGGDRRRCTRLLAGPAAAITMNFCRQLSRSFRMSTGTGFAQPMIGRFVVIAISGNTIVPIRSMCTAGFSDTRPRNRAVGSPSRSAVQACAASCTVREKTRTRKKLKTWAKSMSGKERLGY